MTMYFTKLHLYLSCSYTRLETTDIKYFIYKKSSIKIY